MASSFSRQRNPNMEKALFDWPIVLQYDVKEISRKFFGHEVCLPARSLSQPKPRCVCIRFIHQSNRSISVCLLFLFCSRVFISRSYENRSTSSVYELLLNTYYLFWNILSTAQYYFFQYYFKNSRWYFSPFLKQSSCVFLIHAQCTW